MILKYNTIPIMFKIYDENRFFSNPKTEKQTSNSKMYKKENFDNFSKYKIFELFDL